MISPLPFYKGHGDGRALGIKPPQELRQALGMRPGEQCQLEGGAYGRMGAPFLWLQTLKGFLEELGFIQCPFDATFCLVSPGPNGQPVVHGVLGIQVDDGLGGRDSKFTAAVQKLRDRFSFASYDEGEFTFTGVRFRPSLGSGMTEASSMTNRGTWRVFDQFMFLKSAVKPLPLL